MPRLRLFDLRMSEFPQSNGLCASDTVAVANLANRCQRRLIFAKEAGEEGWWGSWVEVSFNALSRTTPYLTLPRTLARVQQMAVCRHPIQINNQFYEYLQFGNGRMPQLNNGFNNWGVVEAYDRNNAVMFSDLSSTCKLAILTSDSNDVSSGLRVLVQGLDANGSVVYSQDGSTQVMGEYVYFDSPFAVTQNSYSRITGIQKDLTSGSVHFLSIDPTTGIQTPTLIMDPGEQVAGYRRYYLNGLPLGCGPCGSASVPLQVLGLAKLELIPVRVDQDYLVIQNLEAMIEEAWSVHFNDLEGVAAMAASVAHHRKAIGHLNGELNHYLGKDNPAVNFAPFGSARLDRINIGMI